MADIKSIAQVQSWPITFFFRYCHMFVYMIIAKLGGDIVKYTGTQSNIATLSYYLIIIGSKTLGTFSEVWLVGFKKI